MQQVPPPRTKFLDSITSPGCFPVDARANKCVRACVMSACACVFVFVLSPTSLLERICFSCVEKYAPFRGIQFKRE